MASTSRLPNVWIPYIKVTFNDTSLTWRPKEGRPDYFVSLSHKRVVEESPDMTLKITYAPRYGEDPNRIEDAIVKAKGLCYVQYGYVAGWSKLYKALVYSYTVDFREGVLEYTIKLFSEAVTYNKDKVPAYHAGGKRMWLGRRDSTGHEITIAATPEDIISHVEDVVKTYMSGKNNFPGYVFDRSGSTGLGEMIVLSSKVQVDANLNPIEHIEKLLDQVKPCEEDTSYVLEVDDSGTGKGKVRIRKVGSYGKKIVKYKFDWGKRDGTVLSFSPGFDGSGVIFSVSTGKSVEDGGAQDVNSDVDEATLKQYTMVTGSHVTRSSLNNFDTSNNLSAVAKTVKDAIRENNFSYNATLTVLASESQSDFRAGETVIYVNPIIQGQPHHSAGYYFINAATDNVSSQGFTTTYDLRRLSTEEVKSEVKGSIYSTEVDGRVYVDGKFVKLEDYDPHAELKQPTPDRTNPDYPYDADPSVAPAEVPGGFAAPLSGTIVVTSEFGPRGGSSVTAGFHSGIDLRANTGTLVYAAGSGKVTVSTYHSSYGWYVEIDHQNGFKTRYAHGKQKPLVSVGQQVSQGDKVLISGATGNVTGPHLHFEVRYKNKAENPRKYYPSWPK